ncbi:MAG TPA: hypothetical protein VKJ00_05005, partial [Thermoanaerobaculia bacterium]|nr:hypothetical protein [Thermoanaerobaculia bacterium]
MSFILRKRQSSGAQRVAAEATPVAVLPPELVSAGARRIGVVGLLAASVTVLMDILDWRTFGGILPLHPTSQTIWLAAGVSAVVLSLAIAW